MFRNLRVYLLISGGAHNIYCLGVNLTVTVILTVILNATLCVLIYSVNISITFSVNLV